MINTDFPPLDPNLSAAELANIAASSPQSWPQILIHPNCYPGLAEWIQAQQARGSHPITAAPSSSENAAQMKQAAKQFASGAQGYYKEKIAPSVQQASSNAATAWKNRNIAPRQAMQQWTPLVLLVASLFGFIALFLPIATFMGYSLNYFSDELDDSDGPIFIVAFLIVAALALSRLFTSKTWVRIASGIVSILVGVMAIIPLLNFSKQANGVMGADVGSGLILLVFVGVVVIAAGVITLLPTQQNPTQIENS